MKHINSLPLMTVCRCHNVRSVLLKMTTCVLVLWLHLHIPKENHTNNRALI